jgi:SAM-dependent methyltransferase
MSMTHVAAPLVGFELAAAIEAISSQADPNCTTRPTKRFPVRYLRYWFVRHMLDQLHDRLERPLRVLEVGIGDGKMLAFMNGPQVAPGISALPQSIACWDALSADADPHMLERYSYSSFQQADIEKGFELSTGTYDAIILLHVLEHLTAPEAAMSRLLPALRDGGLIVGGSPTMPDCLVGIHERYLRRKYADKMDDLHVHKHLSVISPGRIRRFATAENLSVDLLAGAFMVRSSSNPLENRSWWLRLNLAWGALFPALAGEVYFSLQKT